MAKLKVRARAVDMLGRQQIAGVSTAIHEIFKNGYDAYATKIVADFYRKQQLLVIRDNGFGMTRSDFESVWLTLGTESKFKDEGKSPPIPYKFPNISTRKIMGEKGIGRLAIATIGPQVVVLTRSRRNDGLGKLVVALVNWRLFEAPSINIEEIEIPILEVKGGALPTNAEFAGLKESVLDNVAELGSRLGQARKRTIISETKDFRVDFEKMNNELGAPSLKKSSGTTFIVYPTDPVLESDIDDEIEESAPIIQKRLLGFTNSMNPQTKNANFEVFFRDRQKDGELVERIGAQTFFTPSEFKESADHHFEGAFDEYGTFEGKIKFYNKPSFAWSCLFPGQTAKTECGPYRISMAYVQGDVKDSKLPSEEFLRITTKLNRIGGLYVYRDGIRILPYGDSDFDFLDIEKRRSKSASDWFFSYRRMFGAIDTSSDENFNLIEKAGREGFRANKAYREFRLILMNFLRQLAIEFLRPHTASVYQEAKEEISRKKQVLAEREKRKAKLLDKFVSELNFFFEGTEQETSQLFVHELAVDVKEKAERYFKRSRGKEFRDFLLKLERDARRKLEHLRSNLSIKRPSGIGLTEEQQSDWQMYRKEFAHIEKTVIRVGQRRITRTIQSCLDRASVPIDQRERARQYVDGSLNTAEASASKALSAIKSEASLLQKEVLSSASRELSQLKSHLRLISEDFQKTPHKSFPGPDDLPPFSRTYS